MAMTHRKRLFARHFAKNGDRKAAVEAAGFAMGDWGRVATRLLADPEVMQVIERVQQQAISKFDVARINDAYVLEQMVDLLERIRACGLGAWQAQAETRILELLGKYRQLFSERVEVGLDQKFIEILQQGRERARKLAQAEIVEVKALPEAPGNEPMDTQIIVTNGPDGRIGGPLMGGE